MIGNVSTTKRKVLDKYYTYSVGFKYWEDFTEEVSSKDLEGQAV
jgi:hypothetical protein